MPKSRALTQCRQLQNFAFELAMGFKDLPPNDEAVERHARKALAFAQAAKAWETAVNRARILRGRPLPGSLRPRPPAVKPRHFRPIVPTVDHATARPVGPLA